MSDILIKNMEIPKDSKYVDVRIFRDGTATTASAEEPFYKKMDVAEVVRCKDCKNNYVTTRNHGKQDDPRCDFTDRHLSLDDFCSRGERRMDGE